MNGQTENIYASILSYLGHKNVNKWYIKSIKPTLFCKVIYFLTFKSNRKLMFVHYVHVGIIYTYSKGQNPRTQSHTPQNQTYNPSWQNLNMSILHFVQSILVYDHT
jgi:hypothetical protein